MSSSAPDKAPDNSGIPKAYESASVEQKWLARWKEGRWYHADDKSTGKPTFSMVIPPPNVTGILHMGHALNNTLQDILARYKRMQGFDVMWVPGTDHAGIATQNVVERELKKQNIRRADLGREKFIERVWEWRNQCGGTIIHQLERMGCSCDWERLRFTMDEGLSDAVKEVFVRLYDKGLVYKSNYIVNWCPRCQTALSDEEVTHRELNGALYHIIYKVEGSKDQLVIATTRPETLLGDTAVGFHPEDERYKHLKGKKVVLPLLGRLLPLIQDDQIDPQFGTGSLKITPAHDPVDFNLAKKHNLEFLNIMNTDGTLNKAAGPYAGLDMATARKKVVADLEAAGLLVEVKEHRHAVGHCYRCESVVEPYVSDQWFVRMKGLAEPAIKAVESGEVRFHPERWTKVYMEWMTNIRDWCISRQIWWGHRIPVYYTKDGKYTAARSEAEARKKLGISAQEPLTQDKDVLDTWFSSWLWPFSTMGWPEETPLVKKFYPTQTLVTGYEIIFFWVARMMMAGFEFMGKTPFSDIYIHGIVRDQTGAKMSKSKGNVLDPLEIIDEFGADALRFSIVNITSEGQDVFASKDRFEIGRNFANKIWNASRFVMMNVSEESLTNPALPDVKELQPADLWILSRLQDAIAKITNSLDSFRFNEAGVVLYDFFWGEYCDWYLEFAKNHITKPATQKVALHVLREALKLLHPAMPFVTEEITSLLDRSGKTPSLMVAPWPKADKRWKNESLESDVDEVIQQIKAIRHARATWQIPVKEEIRIAMKVAGQKEEKILANYGDLIRRLARVGTLEAGESITRPAQSVVARVGRIETYVALGGVVDVQKETQRLHKDIQDVSRYVQSLDKKLSNDSFVQKAPPEVIDEERRKKTEAEERLRRLEENLAALA